MGKKGLGWSKEQKTRKRSEKLCGTKAWNNGILIIWCKIRLIWSVAPPQRFNVFILRTLRGWSKKRRVSTPLHPSTLVFWCVHLYTRASGRVPGCAPEACACPSGGRAELREGVCQACDRQAGAHNAPDRRQARARSQTGGRV